MTRNASPPPEGDKSHPQAPPPPPAWRHWLWLIALALFVLLFLTLPTTKVSQPVTLTYSQFLNDVHAHKVQTVTINS
ncbi:MAG TPA: ATP-dependent metallopeptidase FtsH/Yme1/Tma family protein, partial [Acidimicrobiales bacterium]|nr:ATP-dependent metallopeptidase FtsH/Yme1/Tma family protein [Acidimicrobiales bacterium]